MMLGLRNQQLIVLPKIIPEGCGRARSCTKPLEPMLHSASSYLLAKPGIAPGAVPPAFVDLYNALKHVEHNPDEDIWAAAVEQ